LELASCYQDLQGDFLEEFAALRNEMRTPGAADACWPVFRTRVERLALVLLLFGSANRNPDDGVDEVANAVDKILG
jgi:hypothetical protein